MRAVTYRGNPKNYAISVAGSGPNPAGLTSNYNDLQAPGSGAGSDRLTLVAWQGATGQDGASISADPLFLDPNGTARPIGGGYYNDHGLGNEPAAVNGVVDLHVSGTSPCIGAGKLAGGVTSDFDNDARPGAGPAIGADEQPGLPTATPSPTPTPAPPGTPTPTPPAAVCMLTEGYDDITTLVPNGWSMQNNSQPGPGTTGWFQGTTAKFSSQSGASYIAADFNNGSGVSTLSNWLLTPPLTVQNGAQLHFWTRTVSSVSFPDRLQVRLGPNGTGTNVGATATSVGDFTTLLLDINPTYTLSGYPTSWTNYTVTLSGIAAPVTGRLGFRYFVEDAGPAGDNSDYIGLDAVQYCCNANCPLITPTPAPIPTPAPDTAYFLYENFDTTSPPALPSGWSTPSQMGPPTAPQLELARSGQTG